MSKTEDKDLGYTCECGSVNWVMRKDNRLECANAECQMVLDGAAWVETPIKFTTKCADGDGVERVKVGELICDGVEREAEL